MESPGRLNTESNRGPRRRGAPRGRSSLTRKSILQDKEKRKSAIENQATMEALFR